MWRVLALQAVACNHGFAHKFTLLHQWTGWDVVEGCIRFFRQPTERGSQPATRKQTETVTDRLVHLHVFVDFSLSELGIVASAIFRTGAPERAELDQ